VTGLLIEASINRLLDVLMEQITSGDPRRQESELTCRIRHGKSIIGLLMTEFESNFIEFAQEQV
jgi:hypothetical protein